MSNYSAQVEGLRHDAETGRLGVDVTAEYHRAADTIERLQVSVDRCKDQAMKTMEALTKREATLPAVRKRILDLEGVYREPRIGRVLRDILALVEARPLDPDEQYPPRVTDAVSAKGLDVPTGATPMSKEVWEETQVIMRTLTQENESLEAKLAAVRELVEPLAAQEQGPDTVLARRILAIHRSDTDE